MTDREPPQVLPQEPRASAREPWAPFAQGLSVAPRVAALRDEGAFAVLAEARALEARGVAVIHLEIGESHADTPSHVVEAGLRALRDGERRYAPAAGLPDLRAAVAEDLASRGVPANPSEVVITSGGKPALFCALHALVEPGDEVLVPDPGFPSFTEIVRLAGAAAVGYPLDRPLGFRLLPDAIAARITPRSRVLVVNAPHNPTGGEATGATLGAVAELARRHGLWIVSDEVYARLAFDGPAPSIAALAPERTLVVDSFSKSHAMSGWRLGYVAGPQSLALALTRLVTHTASCTPPFVQRAGIAALRGPQAALEAERDRLRANASVLVRGLNRLPGVRCHAPAGTLFAFPDIAGVLARTGEDAEGFARRLLADHGVAVLPGTAFGPGGAGCLRLCFAVARRALERALAALRGCAAGPPDRHA